MNPLWLIPMFLALVAIGVLLWYYLKKKKIVSETKNQEYEEVMNDFRLAEQLYEQAVKGGIENGKRINPHEILWRIARSKQQGFINKGTASEAIGLPPLPERPSGRTVISGSIAAPTSNNESEFDRGERRNNKGLFRRRK